MSSSKCSYRVASGELEYGEEDLARSLPALNYHQISRSARGVTISVEMTIDFGSIDPLRTSNTFWLLHGEDYAGRRAPFAIEFSGLVPFANLGTFFPVDVTKFPDSSKHCSE